MLFQLTRSIIYYPTVPISTHPNLCRNASLNTTNSTYEVGKANTGAMVSRDFNSWKLCSHSSFQSYFIPFLVSRVNGAAISEKCSTNHLYYLAKPKKLQTSETFLGCSQLTIASIFLRSTKIPAPKITCLRKTTSLSQNSHLENLAYNSLSLRVWRTIRKCIACLSTFLEYTNMSSIKNMTN